MAEWTATVEVKRLGPQPPNDDLDRKATAMTRKSNLRLRLRVFLATVTGIAAGITRPIAERLLDLLTH